MKILLVVKQKKNVDTFAGTVRALLERGHAVTLTVQEGHDLRDDWIGRDTATASLSVVRGPAVRTDEWAGTAPLLRSLHDCAHYLQPELRDAQKLQHRSVRKLGEDLEVAGDESSVAAAFRAVPRPQLARLDAILDLAERSLPSDPLWTSFIAEQAPDVVLVSPVVHFGSAQADVVAAAHAVGVPVGMLLFSWDNLSTKGRLHQHPDWMFVWNERQRREADALHGFPRDRVVVVGASRFDAFFERTAQLTRESFHEPLGLDASQPTLLYVCSSAFVSSAERGFIQKWIDAIRRTSSTPLRACNLIVRPHPDIELLPAGEPVTELRWASQSGLKAYVSRPFGDDRAIVLRTSDRLMQGLYESIAHSAAVVGLNTSAELEAAIVGRPVYTILADEDDADGQSGTLHFHYLVDREGGFVKVGRSLDEHVVMLDAELRTPTDPAVLRRFVADFLRPMGIDRPVSPLLADAIEHTFTRAGSAAHGDGARGTRPAPSGVAASLKPLGTESAVPLTGTLAGLRLYTLPEPDGAERERVKADPTTIEWLQQHVAIGDVVYDIGAGIGAYTVVAAKHRGSIVVAFEPGYAAFKVLCENLLLNGCAGSVIPLSLALAEAEGMAELKYLPGRPGQHRHVLRRAPWRVKRGGAEERAFVQPIGMTTLDRVVEQYELPLPNHLRFSEDTAVTSVLAAAKTVLETDRLKTMFLTVQEDQYESVTSVLGAREWKVGLHKPISRGRTHVVMMWDAV